MTHIPAPYESVESDDLAAAVAASLTVSCAGISGWILGKWAYQAIETIVRVESAASWRVEPPAELLVPAVGWGVGVLFLVIGALLLLFRRGRGALIFGALLTGATTVMADFKFGFGGPAVPIEQWPLYWGGVVVFLLAVLPATGRWARRPGLPAGPTLAAYPGGPMLPPGL